MRDTAEILDLYTSASESGERMVLATVIEVSGSAYRRPGAHLLFSESGRKAGSISAGCLESDIIARREELFSLQRSTVLKYENDEIFGLNYGCDGTIFVMVQPVIASRVNYPSAFSRAKASRKQMVLATVFESDCQEFVGRKLLLAEDKVVESELAKELEELILSKLSGTANGDRPGVNAGACNLPLQAVEMARFQFVEVVEFSLHNTRVLIEVINPTPRLVVFGAGDDVIPLLQIAKTTGFEILLVDTRRSYLDRHSNEARTHHFVQEDQSIFEAAERTAVIVMSHNFELDKKFVNAALKHDLAYLGIMGSRKRTLKLLGELNAMEHESNIHFPIGLDIGSESPEEIALSIASEVLMHLRKGTGRPLSQIHGPVHKRETNSDSLLPAKR